MSTRKQVFCLAVGLATLTLAGAGVQAARAQQAPGAHRPEDVTSFRTNIEPHFLRPRGGNSPGYAACVMCHTWQVRPVRFALETPATDAGWTEAQSRTNFEMITQLINTADPENSRLLLKPLAPQAGGLGHTGGTFWTSRDDPEYQQMLAWIKSLPRDRYAQKAQAALDFEFFRSCVQPIFRNPREGQIRCSNCHGAGQMGFAPVPAEGRTAWNDDEAKRAFQVISRLIIPGNPDQSRFLHKPLHPDGGGSYAHNGVRRWPNKKDPEWQMLASWVRGERTGNSCS
jgi:hypothetical protein